MLLVIDTGNTNTLFAIHDGDKWLVEWRIATDASRTADEYAVWFHQLMSMQKMQINDIKACVISSVVPQSLFNMRNLARRHLNVEPIVVGDEGIDIGVAIDIDNPKEVGSDRLVTALGALQKYEGNLLIVDSGTATTFDIISKDNEPDWYSAEELTDGGSPTSIAIDIFLLFKIAYPPNSLFSFLNL